MRFGFVYETTNLIDSKKYIGKHKRRQDINDPDDSWYLGSGKILLLAIDKYGPKNFSRKILCECDSEDHLREMEKYYIDHYRAVEDPMYYNLIEDANPPIQNGSNWVGRKHSEETKKLLSELHKGRVRVVKNGVVTGVTKKYLQNYLDTGWEIYIPEDPVPDEEAIRLQKEESFKNRSEASKRTWEKKKSEGWKMPDSQKAAISRANTGKTHSQETKDLISKRLSGKAKSQEFKDNLSNKLKHNEIKFNLTCKRCGVSFIGTKPSIKICDNCRKEM